MHYYYLEISVPRTSLEIKQVTIRVTSEYVFGSFSANDYYLI